MFTTVPLHRALPVPVREVSFFLDAEDMRGVRDLLTGANVMGDLAPYFSRELFVPNLHAEDKTEAIEKLCEVVAAHKDVPADFTKLVLRREELAQTSFGNQVAMPHSVKAVTDETFVCIGVLDRAIEWNGKAVRAIFLVSVSKAKNKKLDRFYRSMSKLLTSKEAIQELIDSQAWETVVKLLNAYGNTDKDK